MIVKFGTKLTQKLGRRSVAPYLPDPVRTRGDRLCGQRLGGEQQPGLNHQLHFPVGWRLALHLQQPRRHLRLVSGLVIVSVLGKVAAMSTGVVAAIVYSLFWLSTK